MMFNTLSEQLELQAEIANESSGRDELVPSSNATIKMMMMTSNFPFVGHLQQHFTPPQMNWAMQQNQAYFKTAPTPLMDYPYYLEGSHYPPGFS